MWAVDSFLDSLPSGSASFREWLVRTKDYWPLPFETASSASVPSERPEMGDRTLFADERCYRDELLLPWRWQPWGCRHRLSARLLPCENAPQADSSPPEGNPDNKQRLRLYCPFPRSTDPCEPERWHDWGSLPGHVPATARLPVGYPSHVAARQVPRAILQYKAEFQPMSSTWPELPDSFPDPPSIPQGRDRKADETGRLSMPDGSIAPRSGSPPSSCETGKN